MSKLFIGRRLGVLLVAGGFLAVALAITYNAFYGNAVTRPTTLYVGSDTEYASVRTVVGEAIGSGLRGSAFDLYARRINLATRVKAGYYRLERGQSVIRIARMLALGEQSPVHLVVGEARTLPQLAGKLSRQIETDSASLLKALNNKALRKEVGYVRDSLIALFLPNTYQVWWSITPEALVRRMKRESDTFWNSERREQARKAGLTPYEVMTLASIVYEETKQVGEMPKIAGVYVNRLRKGMALQACPTVKYAMGDFGLKRVLHKHLKYRSPFNTYINRGLPPAPICIPSLAAIDAVLNYERSSYLYFCAKPTFDGTHNFARTLSEHNRNAAEYAKALNRASKNN